MSLADNIQESFGLTIVEAMASALPVIASDWDGYRDTVEHGSTGFLVPTIMAPSGSGEEIGRLHGLSGRPYNRYLADVSQATSVDVDAAARAVSALASDDDLRARMGRAGRRRARTMFDQTTVMTSYRELWEELDARRRAQPPREIARSPFCPDPFSLFSDFPTAALERADRLALRAGWAPTLDAVRSSPILRSPSDLLLGDDALRQLVDLLLADRSATAGALCDAVGDQNGRTARSLVWLLKTGVVERG